MYNVERKAEIIALLEEHGEVDVNSLSERFQTSKETVRRDLGELEKQGILTRTHGGALYNDKQGMPNFAEYPVGIREIQRHHEKNLICKRAVEFLRDGDTVFIDNSSTTMYLIQYIPKDLRLTVLTNSIKVLLESLKNPRPHIDYICFGGYFHDSNLSFYGSTALKHAAEYFPDKALVSCTGLNDKGIITDASTREAESKRLMIAQSKKLFLLADYSKFSITGQVYLAQLKPGNVVVTDGKITPEHRQMLKPLGAQLFIA